jgi:uncharacterized protein YecA (UPF0149 family)
MQASTGEIFYHDTEEDLKAREKQLQEMLVPIDEEVLPKVKKMNKSVRKGWARNQPCPCGSGRKYKKCCLGR